MSNKKRRDELLNKEFLSKEEEKELKELVKKYPFGNKSNRRKALRIYHEGIIRLLGKIQKNKVI